MNRIAEANHSSWPLRLLAYAIAFALGLAFPILNYRLDLARIDAPLSLETDRITNNDAYLILPMVLSTLEGGTHWTTERMGFPGRQQMHDFPVIDHFHFVLLWLIGQFTGSAVVTFNVYYLLGYPLAAVSMMAVLRAHGASLTAGLTCGVLFAALPYHQYRGQNHYFLSAYFIVPLTCHAMLIIGSGKLDRIRSRRGLMAAIIMIVTASAGAYYAFYACALMMVAGIYGAIAHGTWRIVWQATAVTGLIVIGGIVNHLPTYFYHFENGKHTTPVERYPEDADAYGLKVAQLLLPMDNHRWRAAAEMKAIYNTVNRPAQVYTERYSLGAVSAIGFLALTVILFLPRRVSEPFRLLATLVAACVAIGIVGGFGSIFNLLVTASVRCYNRIAIYIAFFCLTAIALGLDRLLHRFRERLSRRAFQVVHTLAWLIVLAFGLWDQTPHEWAWDSQAAIVIDHQKRWQADAKFFGEIETWMNPERITPGPAVFQLPYVIWPESASVHQLAPYDHARGYLHTRTLRWSFGCMKGREIDEWLKTVAIMPRNAVENMLDRLVLAGFEGLLVDQRGYSPEAGADVVAKLRRAIPDAHAVVHEDRKQIFFDLRRYRDSVQPLRDWDAEAYRETHRPSILWLDGFHSGAEPGYEWTKRSCGPRGTAMLLNPTRETIEVRFSFRVIPTSKEPAKVIIQSEIWNQDIIADKGTKEHPKITHVTAKVAIPPGRHAVRFRCISPESHMPTEFRRLAVIFEEFTSDVPMNGCGQSLKK